MHKLKLIYFILVAFLFSLNSQTEGYRFICNGILADGSERSDECGVCDDEYAARWPNPNLPIIIDDSTLPKGISKEQWRQVVSDSFAAWNEVSGSNARLFSVEGTNGREFGANSAAHEIFWITDREEWRTQVGVGEFGTLGATLPRYNCGGDLGSKRVIFDADLVLNGLPHINWQVDCQDDDCISPQTTLVHELGHYLGLDHPCLLCSTSVMSARAGFEVKYPLFDDMQALRILYPEGEDAGFGFPCTNDDDCNIGFSCKADNEAAFCTNACSSDSDCEIGAICSENSSFCTFIGVSKDSLRSLGQKCSRVPCEEPLVCVGPGEENFYCFLPCFNEEDCPNKESCISIDSSTSICIKIGRKNDKCDHTRLCKEGLSCVFENEGSGHCRAKCNKENNGRPLCGSQEICQVFDDGEEICVPISNHINLGESSQEFMNRQPAKDRFNDNTESQNKKRKSQFLSCTGGNAPLGLGLCLVVGWLFIQQKRRIIGN